MYLTTVDLSALVFNKANGVSTPFAWAKELRRYFFGIFRDAHTMAQLASSGDHQCQCIIVLHADGPNVTEAKQETQYKRSLRFKDFPIDESRPVIPESPFAPLDSNWAVLMSNRIARRQAIAFIVRAISEGFDTSDDAMSRPMALPPGAQLLTYMPAAAGERLVTPTLYNDMWQARQFHEFALPLGEGDFLPLMLSLHVRRLQYRDAVAARVARITELTEERGRLSESLRMPAGGKFVEEHNYPDFQTNVTNLNDLDAMACYDSDYEDVKTETVLKFDSDEDKLVYQQQSQRLEQLNAEIDQVTAEQVNTVPSGFIRLVVNANDSDLLIIPLLAYPTLNEQKIDCVLNLGPKRNQVIMTRREARAKLPRQEFESLAFKMDRKLKEETAVVSTTYDNLYLDFNALYDHMLRHSGVRFADYIGSVAFMALFGDSDLLPIKPIGGFGLKRVLDTMIESRACVVMPPAKRTTWNPDKGIVPVPTEPGDDVCDVDFIGSEIHPRFMRSFDKVQVLHVIRGLLVTSIKDKDLGANPKLTSTSDLLKFWNNKNASRRGKYTIDVGARLEMAMSRCMYAVHYYGVYGWNVDSRQPSPAKFGWKRALPDKDAKEEIWLPAC